jgi:hypothetical protein
VRGLLQKIALPLLMLHLAGCEVAGGSEGYVYFAAGNYLGKLDLADGSSSIAASVGNMTIQQISRVDDTRLLLSVRATVDYLEIDRILRVDVVTGRREPLFEGSFARFLPATRSIIYDDGKDLMAVRQRTATYSDPLIYAHRLNGISEIVVTTDDELLFDTRVNGKHRIFRYSDSTRVVEEMKSLSELCRLDGAVWISSLGKLACKTNAQSTYVLTDLTASDRAEVNLPRDKTFRVLAYLPDQHALILSEAWQGWFAKTQNSAVWLYQFDSQTSRRLFKNQHLGDSVVYSEN